MDCLAAMHNGRQCVVYIARAAAYIAPDTRPYVKTQRFEQQFKKLVELKAVAAALIGHNLLIEVVDIQRNRTLELIGVKVLKRYVELMQLDESVEKLKAGFWQLICCMLRVKADALEVFPHLLPIHVALLV